MADGATYKQLVAPRVASTTWLGSEVSVERSSAAEPGLTRLQRFDPKNKPGPGAALWDSDVARRLREVSAQHAHLVPFVAMEGPDELGRPALRTVHLPEADSLHDYIAKQREPFSLRDRIEILAGVLSALKALHERDLAHNELNAHALLIVRDPRTRAVSARLTGYASITPATGQWSDHSPLQPPYSYVGPHGQPRDRRLRDLYAAGVVAYELLAWTLLPSRPIETPSAFAEMHVTRLSAIWKTQLPPASALTLRTGLESLIRELLTCGEKLEPKHGAHTVLQQLSKLPRPAHVEPLEADPERSRKRWWWLLVPGLTAIAAYWHLNRQSPEPPPVRPVETKVEALTAVEPPSPRNALPETHLELRTNTHYDDQSTLECVGYTFGAKEAQPSCSEQSWPFGAGDARFVFDTIMRNNRATVGDRNRPILRVVYFGILTGLGDGRYGSQLDELRGLLAIQARRNAITKTDLPLIQIGIANGGLDQSNATYVAQQLLDSRATISAILGFADSRQGTQDAIHRLGAQSVFTFASMLSADSLTKEPTFISQVPPNVLEAELFATYREESRKRHKEPSRYRNVTVYKTYGPNNRRDDIYVNSLEADIRRRLRADLDNNGQLPDGGHYVAQDFLSAKDCANASLLKQHCPSDKNLVIFAGRFTEFECFGKTLAERCGDISKLAPHVLGDDSVARVNLTMDSGQTLPPIAGISYVSKSYELRCDAKDPFPQHPNLQDAVLAACQAPRYAAPNDRIRRHTLLSMINLMDLYDAAAAPNAHRGTSDLVTSSELFLSFSATHMITRQVVPDEPRWSIGGARRMFFNEPARFQAQEAGKLSGFTPVHSALSLVQRTEKSGEQLLCSCWYSLDHKPVCGCQLP